MNATSTAGLSASAQRFSVAVLEVIPTLERGSHRKRFIRSEMLSFGWRNEETDDAIRELLANGILSLSDTRKSVCFAPYPHKPRKSAICVYCNTKAIGKHLTRDHVKPRSHGGCDGPSNVVHCCNFCNQSKKDRTPRQWARDILSHDRPINPVRFRLQLLAASITVFVAWIGGAR